ncbi:MAG TPA: class II D-tagatose-bisphosphate aldolase, non-catalytic subunit [Candidatus Sulfotelmatobacter sp.]|nr:class II D-tagatose-bisphosphate aldolase, non-catalytic subunit [Candidatus Sulfotelmatobacter sp.]
MTARGIPSSRNATQQLQGLLRANRRGKGLGIYSICSANRFVLEAGMLQAARDRNLLLVECTSNQVNQFGGYTGQTPADFVRFICEIAQKMRFPPDQIMLGGDHLGPQAWCSVPAAAAMEKACQMVGEYVRAGFIKIHLDASMPCAGDLTDPEQPLSDEMVSSRAAQLCQAAEAAYRSLPRNSAPPIYVIGTEVPAPGGGHLASRTPKVTRTQDLGYTLALARNAFIGRRLHAAWERVIAVVVQPGVEFGDASVSPYDSRKAQSLARFITRHWTGVYEAHSTDYQTREALRQMVKDHFAILKVGPWLTFAFREAVFALEAIEREWLAGRSGIILSGVQEALEKAMLENPAHWKNYYHGDDHALRVARKYSYSDRARYYWPRPFVAEAIQRLISNLTAHPAPPSLLSQFLPRDWDAVRTGKISNQPADLIRHRILEVLDQYAYACGLHS